jgi:hypothetical protein
LKRKPPKLAAKAGRGGTCQQDGTHCLETHGLGRKLLRQMFSASERICVTMIVRPTPR